MLSNIRAFGSPVDDFSLGNVYCPDGEPPYYLPIFPYCYSPLMLKKLKGSTDSISDS